MHKTKIIITLCLLLCCCLILSSCGEKGSSSNSNKEFKFNDAITWNSSKDDIVQIYQFKKNYSKNDTSLEYHKYKYCGYDGSLCFSFDINTNALTEINIIISWIFNSEAYRSDPDILSVIKKQLVTNYGNPSKEETNDEGYANIVWDSPAKDTIISLSRERTISDIIIQFQNKSTTNP